MVVVFCSSSYAGTGCKFFGSIFVHARAGSIEIMPSTVKYWNLSVKYYFVQVPCNLALYTYILGLNISDKNVVYRMTCGHIHHILYY